MPVPAWPYETMKRWHELSLINTGKTRRMLAEIGRTAEAADEVAALAHLIEEEQGFALSRAVEATKIELSAKGRALFSFYADPIHIEAEVARPEFEAWIAPELDAIAECVDGLL